MKEVEYRMQRDFYQNKVFNSNSYSYKLFDSYTISLQIDLNWLPLCEEWIANIALFGLKAWREANPTCKKEMLGIMQKNNNELTISIDLLVITLK